MTHPVYGQLRQVTPLAGVVLERNPSPMTLEGTNSWVLRPSESSGCVVVDPGHDDREHLVTLADAAGDVALILLTHHHVDHAEGAPWFAERVAAPVRAFDASLCRDGAPLGDGERIDAAGMTITVRHTPGHTADSVCLVVEHDAGVHVLTGDTILGYGTTVLSDLGDYLDTLRVLAGDTVVPDGAIGLPGHGPELPNLRATVLEYREHREQRLDQVRGALAQLGRRAGAREIVEHVYTDVDPVLWAAAEVSVRAQLEYLRRVGEL